MRRRASAGIEWLCWRWVKPAVAMAVCLSAGLAEAARPAKDEQALQLLNDFRGREQRCRSEELPAAPPLQWEPRLSRLQPTTSEALRREFERSGFATVQVLVARGGGSLATALRGMMQRYCDVLLDPGFTAVGISQAETDWYVALGKPAVTDELPAWPAAGRAVLEAVNRARAEARHCGEEWFEAVPPLQWNQPLALAALAHSRDMAARNYFNHIAPNGGKPGERVRQQGYAWRTVGENIAAGHSSVEKVVDGWLGSPPHCANIMSSRFSEAGVAYGIDPDSDRTIYWTQTFALPR